MRGPGIRLMEERRDAESGEMTDEQFAFVRAVDDWKLRNRRPYPTLTEILAVAKTLGYRLGGGELRAAPPIERGGEARMLPAGRTGTPVLSRPPMAVTRPTVQFVTAEQRAKWQRENTRVRRVRDVLRRIFPQPEARDEINEFVRRRAPAGDW